jgi:uncharacterized protein
MPDPGLDSLRLDLAALRRRGIARQLVDVELPVEWIAAALAETDATVEAPGHVKLDVLLQPRGVVYAEGSLDVAFEVPCGRCLEPAIVQDHSPLTATFMPVGDATPREQVDEEEDLGEDDADHWTYAGTGLDLTELVVEHVKLAYPMRALCAHGEACRGLCSNCGADLNAQTGLVCASCGNAVPQIPVADVPDSADDAAAPEDEPSTALADALRKLIS